MGPAPAVAPAVVDDESWPRAKRTAATTTMDTDNTTRVSWWPMASLRGSAVLRPTRTPVLTATLLRALAKPRRSGVTTSTTTAPIKVSQTAPPTPKRKRVATQRGKLGKKGSTTARDIKTAGPPHGGW